MESRKLRRFHLMPGSVQNAAPTTVLPQSLCRAFTHSREYPVVENEYRNGESQRSAQAATSRKRWRLAKRLTPAQLAQLRDFFEARAGSLQPFFFYDGLESTPRWNYDPTGVDPNGRFTVRFDSAWNQSVTLGRADVEIELIELA
jgi:hypothetical protein